MIVDPGDFDPFEFHHLYRNVRHRPTYVLVPAVLAIAAIVVLVSLFEGTFGTPAAFQPVDDIKRVFGIPGPPPSAPSFPLTRDLASWILLAIVLTGALLLHWQWRLMASCLSDLARNGVLLMKRDMAALRAGKGLTSRMLGIDDILDQCTLENALPTFLSRTMNTLRRRRFRLFVAIAILAFALSSLLVLGQAHGLFQTFAPQDLTAAQRQQWLNEAYANWWASDHHVFGHIVYRIIAWIAMYVVLSFQVTGFLALYVGAALGRVAQPSADWLNGDGRYGWGPLARVYRSMILGLALLGLALTVILAVLGVENFPWISFLLVVYLIVVPSFALGPRLISRRVERLAKSDRVADLREALAVRKLDVDRDFDEVGPFLAEADRIAGIRIRPLRLLRFSISTFIVLVLLPIILAAAQILFPLEFGAK